MRLTVTVEDPARREELQGRIVAVEQVDRGLRTSFSGFDPESIVPEARTSLAAAGVQMDEEELHAYARSIAERQDFTYTLS